MKTNGMNSFGSVKVIGKMAGLKAVVPLLLLIAIPVGAAELAPIVIQMKSLSYDPKIVQVEVGQKVVWKNTAYTSHSATEDKSGFDTGLIEPKTESKPIVFSTAGTHSYHCSIHGKTMSGVIVVKGK